MSDCAAPIVQVAILTRDEDGANLSRYGAARRQETCTNPALSGTFKLPLPKSSRSLISQLRALSAMVKGIVTTDVKPQNIFWYGTGLSGSGDQGGQVGSSASRRIRRTGGRMTRDADALGTPRVLCRRKRRSVKTQRSTDATDQ